MESFFIVNIISALDQIVVTVEGLLTYFLTYWCSCICVCALVTAWC